eukprot:scaffold244814_cov21-Tisochrysis_lutea.AAC.1
MGNWRSAGAWPDEIAQRVKKEPDIFGWLAMNCCVVCQCRYRIQVVQVAVLLCDNVKGKRGGCLRTGRKEN